MTDSSNFGEMMQAGLDRLRRGFNPGEKISGTVVMITKDAILLDINAKSEGLIEKNELVEDGQLKVKVGDTVEAYYVDSQDDNYILTTRVSAREAEDADLARAYEAEIPVEGIVVKLNKAGLEIRVGQTRGFCPISQVELHRVEDLTPYENQSLNFLITEYEPGNLVVSRRRLLEREQREKRKQLEEGLRVGDIISGTVVRLADFGVFVNIGGIDGLIPMGELAWERVQDAASVVKPGQEVKVKVLKLDWDRERVSLSLRQAGGDPWQDVEYKFQPGISYFGTVTRLVDFGAFVQLEPGIEGLLHISKLNAGHRVNHPSEVLQEGQELEVYVDSVDLERRRISLSRESRRAPRDATEAPAAPLAVGDTVEGVVDGVKPFGVFVRLSDRQKGLLHISEIEGQSGERLSGSLPRRYPEGTPLKVLVKDIKGDRISLALPSPEEEADDASRRPGDKRAERDFGSLGGMFDDIKL